MQMDINKSSAFNLLDGTIGISINITTNDYGEIAGNSHHKIVFQVQEEEIDDRGECVFSDTENVKLPAIGTICGRCGLIQDADVRNCLYCGLEINTTFK